MSAGVLEECGRVGEEQGGKRGKSAHAPPGHSLYETGRCTSFH